MSYTSRLSVKVAAAALVTFSAACFLASHAAQAQDAHKPEFAGKKDAGAVNALITPSAMGGGVVILLKLDGTIEAYAINSPGPNPVGVLMKDQNGTWRNQNGDPENPPVAKYVKGEGSITDIQIYEGSNCVMMKLGGQWICVTS